MDLIAYDHVGIRVADRETALRFYTSLGFKIDEKHSDERVAEMVNRSGIRLALIFNGQKHQTGGNVLMDVPVKYPGYTHAAFVVDKLDDVLAWAKAHAVQITEGPVNWDRRLTCFLRDPDRNVLEFNELLSDVELSA